MHGCRRRVHRLRPWRVVYDLCREGADSADSYVVVEGEAAVSDAELLALFENVG
jgi:hypothetical protein